MKKCPYCAENIQDQVMICKYCAREIQPGLPVDDRKQCPFCSEWIRKEAIICRFCQRAIVQNPINIDKTPTQPRLWKKVEDLSLDDLELLIKSITDSYDIIPHEINEKIKSSLSYTLFLEDVLGKLLRFKRINKTEMALIMRKSLFIGWQCWVLCSFIGIESALGNIEDHNVPIYLAACTNPFELYLIGFMNELKKTKRVKPDYASRLINNLKTYLTETSISFANQGFVYFTEVKPKFNGKKSPLSIRLLSLDLSSIDS